MRITWIRINSFMNIAYWGFWHGRRSSILVPCSLGLSDRRPWVSACSLQVCAGCTGSWMPPFLRFELSSQCHELLISSKFSVASFVMGFDENPEAELKQRASKSFKHCKAKAFQNCILSCTPVQSFPTLGTYDQCNYSWLDWYCRLDSHYPLTANLWPAQSNKVQLIIDLDSVYF